MQILLQQIIPSYFEKEQISGSEIWDKNITFSKGEHLHIVAPSGSGKTSLIHFLYGLRKDYEGTISYEKEDIKNFSLEKFSIFRQKNLSIVFQDLRLFNDQTVKENIELKRQLNPYHPPLKIDEMAKRLGIANKLNRLAKTCSYGEQQRIAIIRSLMQPFGRLPVSDWLDWNARMLSWPAWEPFKYFMKNGIWFAWPAWPFAGWAVYAWRKQFGALHIALPLLFLNVVAVLAILDPVADENILLPLLPPLAMLAAFGLPTMKRGAINAVDWFSVMTLTTCAAFIWVGWIAKQTGWPAQLARNAFKLAPGFRPEFSWVAFLVAAAATAGWFVLVNWRISRRPQVLWRAVVLSSGGVILCWLLLMTLWLPWGNYMKSYAGVAQQIARALPPVRNCVSSDVGPAQRASFAFFGQIPFARFTSMRCDFLLLQDKSRAGAGDEPLLRHAGNNWLLLWEGHRPSDRDERFRLFQRVP